MLAGASQVITDALTEYGEIIGTLFQLADDVIDIASETNESGKTPGTDLREGVPTLVSLYILESNDPADSQLRTILSAPITDEAVVASTLATLREHEAIKNARRILVEYADQARAKLQPLPDGPAKAALSSLCEAIITRTA
jgi:heptaprenyl diphosphate synthase